MATRTTERALGRYELLMPIASGGMARVWAARRTGAAGFRKLVAVKTILDAHASDPAFRAMFLDEARIASAVRHPNVCETSDLGADRGVLFMALEWIDGVSLHRLLRGGRPLPLRIAARIVADACAGLHAAHEALDDDGAPLAIVHRDVSPHNVLLSSEGMVKVTDFGVAKALGKSHVSTVGEVKGKLSYMAPEQLRSGKVDRRADVFALGCLLYEMTTGKKTFDAESDARILQKILGADFVLPRAAVAAYPAELERIVLRAIAESPDARFASANGLRLALERWLTASGAPITALDLAALVRDRCGSELDERRARIHALCKDASDLPELPAEDVLEEVTAATRCEGAPASHAKRRRRWLGAAVAGMTACAAIFAGSEAIPARPSPRAVRAATTPREARAVAVQPSSRAPLPDGVTIRGVPSETNLIVDGEPAPPGILRLSRPEPGGMHVVLVKADGYVERLVLVDDTTPSELDVPLEAAPRAPDS